MMAFGLCNDAHGNQSIAVMLSTYTTRTFIVVFIVNTFLLIYKAFVEMMSLLTGC